MKRFWILLAITVIASGCMGGSSEPETDTNQPINQPSFSEVASKAELSEYSVRYSYDGPGPLIYSGRPEVYSYNGVRKVRRPGQMPGGSEISYNVYYSGDIEIDCSEGMRGLSGCSTLPTDVAPSTDYYDYRIDRFNVTKKGVRTHLDRQCYLYRLSGGDFINSYMDICLDREKGFVSFLEMKSDEFNRTVMEMEAEAYKPTASAENVSAPVNAVPSISCYDETVNITTTDYSGLVTFNVNEGENRTIEMDDWSEKSFNITGKIVEGENTVKAYAGSTVGESFCRS